jgi:peptidoglycan/xylan/chitin deacetylase (PgdA/CDA1 family)
MRPIKDKRVIGLGILFVILLGGTMTYAAVNEGTVARDTALRTVNATRGFWVGINNVINQNREATFTNITASENLNVSETATINSIDVQEINLNSVNITDALLYETGRNIPDNKAIYSHLPYIYTIDNMDTIWTVSTGTASIDYNTYFEGNASIKMQGTAGSGGVAMITKAISIPNVNESSRDFFLWIKSTNMSLLTGNGIQVRLYSGGSYKACESSNVYYYSFSPDVNGWYRATFHLSGAGDEDITAIRIYAYTTADDCGNYPEIWVDNFARGSVLTPMVTFYFDDGGIDTYNIGKKYLDQYGYRAVVAAITSTIGAVDKMTYTQLLELQASGWDIASHTVNHSAANTLTPAQREYQLSKSYTDLKTHGVNPMFFVAPYGFTYDEAYLYYHLQRATSMYENSYGWNPYHIAYKSVDEDVVKNQYLTYLDQLSVSGGWANIVFHSLSGADYTRFTEVVDKVHELGIKVVTLTDVYNGITNLDSNGITTVINGTTTVNVTHYCNFIPKTQEINIHPTESLGLSSYYWINNITNTTFTINLNIDPGKNVKFAWNIYRP